jgi:hypothetical protein
MEILSQVSIKVRMRNVVHIFSTFEFDVICFIDFSSRILVNEFLKC